MKAKGERKNESEPDLIEFIKLKVKVEKTHMSNQIMVEPPWTVSAFETWNNLMADYMWNDAIVSFHLDQFVVEWTWTMPFKNVNWFEDFIRI